jgi:TetR/AcrR family transcriptional regulator
MSDEALAPIPDAASTVKRQRMKPGERREQILQTLAAMLEEPGAERITTASLAAQLAVSEAALYRHFASKAQMFEGLIEFIEHSLFGLIQHISQREEDPADKAAHMVAVVLQFAEKNPGMSRVMVGDALVLENERLQQRINHLFDKLELSLRQVLRDAANDHQSAAPSVDAQVRAAALVSFVMGSLQRFVRSGFKRSPLDYLDATLGLML